MRYYFTDHNKLARLLKLNINIYIHSNQTADTLAPSNADRVEIKATPTSIEPGLPQRIGFTAEPMSCGMLLRGWINFVLL
jgi:hypothetical protein